MRIKNSPLTRAAGIREPFKKTFLMMEGTETEPRYFYSFFEINHINNMNVYFFVKEWNEIGWSNPKVLVDYIKEDKTRNLLFTYSTVENELLLRFRSQKNDLDSNLFALKYEKIITEEFTKKMTDDIDVDTLSKALDELKDVFFKNYLFSTDIMTKEEIGKLYQGVTYDADIDQVVLVVDRDRQSFTESQFNYVLEKCQNSNITFLVTNTCFEFFLALHLSDCSSIGQADLLANALDEEKHSFAYKTLITLDPTFSKNKYDAEKYVKLFKKALNNSRLFENDLRLLKDKVGTNVPKWLDSLAQGLTF